MKLAIPKLNISPQYFLRQCGYIEITNPHKNDEVSYARSLDPGRFYPRFHAYLENSKNGFTINLHLDMKKPSYEGTSAHSGEYEGEVVETEATRIKKISERMLSKISTTPLGFKERKSWWKRMFGI